MSKLIIIFLFFILLLSQFVLSSNTLNNAVLQSVGLNTTINLTFQITFDELVITNNSIELYNISYIHPNSCNQQLSTNPLFNYTTANQSLTSIQAFSSIQCVGGGGSIQHCPICHPKQEYSQCIQGIKVRYVYYCSPNTNYECIQSIEKKDCFKHNQFYDLFLRFIKLIKKIINYFVFWN